MPSKNNLNNLQELKIKYKSPEWYDLRKNHIGGSDAAVILGISKFKSITELYMEKTGQIQSAEITNERIEYGIKAEEHITQLFALEHPDYEVVDTKDIVFVRDYMMASLDAKLIEKATGKLGILEVKTATPTSLRAWAEWDDGIPDHYYAQVLHYLNTTGFDFVVVRVRFRVYAEDNSVLCSEREYKFYREKCLEDMAVLEVEEQTFIDSVKNQKRPAAKLPLI